MFQNQGVSFFCFHFINAIYFMLAMLKSAEPRQKSADITTDSGNWTVFFLFAILEIVVFIVTSMLGFLGVSVLIKFGIII